MSSNIALHIGAIVLGALLVTFGISFRRDYRGVASRHYDELFPALPKAFRGRPDEFDRESLRELVGIPAIVFGLILIALGAYFIAGRLTGRSPWLA